MITRKPKHERVCCFEEKQKKDKGNNKHLSSEVLRLKLNFFFKKCALVYFFKAQVDFAIKVL